MTDYYIRCRYSDRAELISLGQLLGVIQEVDNVITPVGAGCWDEIGLKYPPVVEGDPLPEPVGGAIDPYCHVNFRTVRNIRELAEAMAAEQPDVAAGLADISRYFVTDANGDAVTPEFPVRVFL